MNCNGAGCVGDLHRAAAAPRVGRAASVIDDDLPVGGVRIDVTGRVCDLNAAAAAMDFDDAASVVHFDRTVGRFHIDGRADLVDCDAAAATLGRRVARVIGDADGPI